jgi:hypothetical protein
VLAVGASAPAVPPDEEAMRRDYENLVQRLDHKRIAQDYPKAVEHLDSADPQVQMAGLKTLAATGEVSAIPWIVPLLDSEDRQVRIHAGLYAEMVVGNTRRFIEFRDMCGDMSKLSIITFQPGHLIASDFFAADARVMRNSFVYFGYANRVQIRVKIEDMVFVDGKCYIAAMD